MKIKCMKLKFKAILSGIIIGLSACTVENLDLRTEENMVSYDRIGELHNQGLDYVFNKIATNSPITKSGGKVLPQFTEVKQMCDEFAKSKGYKVVTRSPSDNSYYEDELSYLTDRQKDYLLQVKTIVQKASPKSLPEFIREMKVLENNLLKDDEIIVQNKEVLLYVMAVCRHSAIYWAENYEKWQVELNGVNTGKMLQTRSENGVWVSKEWWEHYKEIVWADGVSGVASGGGYQLSDATAGSVMAYLGDKV